MCLIICDGLCFSACVCVRVGVYSSKHKGCQQLPVGVGAQAGNLAEHPRVCPGASRRCSSAEWQYRATRESEFSVCWRNVKFTSLHSDHPHFLHPEGPLWSAFVHMHAGSGLALGNQVSTLV